MATEGSPWMGSGEKRQQESRSLEEVQLRPQRKEYWTVGAGIFDAHSKIGSETGKSWKLELP